MSTGPDFLRYFQIIFGVAEIGLQLFGLGLIIWLWASCKHPGLILMAISAGMNVLFSLAGYGYGIAYAQGWDIQVFYLLIRGMGLLSALLGIGGLGWFFRWVLTLLQYRDMVEWGRNNLPGPGPGAGLDTGSRPGV